MIELTVAIALSIAMSTLVAETMVLAGIWSYRGGLWVLIGLSMLGASFQVAAARRKTVER